MLTYALIGCEVIKRSRHVYWLVLLAGAAWLAMIVAAPWLMATQHALSAMILYRACALVCHQQPARSFTWWGFPLGVCVRCLGAYVGFACGWLCALRLPRLPRRRLFLAIAPLVIDWGLGATGLWLNTPLSRWLTGMLAGFAAAWYLLHASFGSVAALHKSDSGETFLTWLK